MPKGSIGPAPSTRNFGDSASALSGVSEAKHVVETEQGPRNGHLTAQLGRFGDALASVGGRGTTYNLFWSV